MVRLDSVSCAICMESLFCKRDDLDELCQIATPDCGHVFHEDCIRQWFKAQTVMHMAQQRDIRGRSISPSSEISEGPAECPTCRTECFAADDSGEPLLHRLFINFEGGGIIDGSSQLESTPTRSRWKERESKLDAEVMGFAKRAKDISQEVKRVESRLEGVIGSEFEGLISRGEGLGRDLVSLKAIDGVKKYVGGLTAAINNLRTAVATNSLTAELRNDLIAARAQYTDLTAKKAELQRQLKELLEILMPQEICSAVKKERRESFQAIKRVQAEKELFEQQLAKEAVLRKTARREMEERLKAEEKKTADALLLAKKETTAREKLAADLVERVRQLRTFQSKAESRKVSKAEFENLRTENARLQAQIREFRSGPQRSESRPNPRESLFPNDEIVDSGELHDMSAPSSPLNPRDPKPNFDDSLLEIELPSFAISNVGSGSRSKHDHPTSRIFASDQFGSDPLKPKKRPLPQPVAPSKTSKHFNGALASASGASCGSTAKKNYLSESEESDDARASVDASDAETSSAKRSRTINPFSSTKEDTERKKKLLPRSLILGRPVTATSSRSSRQVETIDMCSSPEERAPLRVTQPNGSGSRSGVGSEPTGSKAGLGMNGKKPLAKQSSIVEVLKLADKNGRPVKGLASGAKVRRKA